MAEVPTLLRLPSHGGVPKAFYTDLKEGGEVQQQEGKLNRYVDNINQKIDYAKWKQQLVLKYNYLPMKRIADKIENDKLNYIRKIAEQQKNCAKILSGKEITVQLDLFREFSKKLNEKLQDLQVKIADEKIKNGILTQQADSKRTRLKTKMRKNMDVIRSTLEKQGVSNKEDIMTLVRSRSMKDRFNPTSLTFDSKRATTDRKMATSRKLSSQHSSREISSNDLLFRQCFDKLILSIQAMKTSEDIQSGIYLDIMERSDKKKYSTQGRYSIKSKISDTIHKRFGSVSQQQVKDAKSKGNFQMSWETFRQLNWKQIMGIIMVKDPNCRKTRQLLRFK